MRARLSVVRVAYVVLVACLAASAFSSPNEGFTWGREGIAMLLTLPALLVALPAIYAIGASIRNLTGADSGGPMWPVTLVYMLMFAAVAMLNVWFLPTLLRFGRGLRDASLTDESRRRRS